MDIRFGDIVLHNDHQIIACNKPAGLPTQEDKTGDTSLHRMAQAYCKRDLFIVHRLDRPSSGLVVFAKSKAAAAQLSQQFAGQSAQKTYYAVVGKGVEPREGTMIGYIRKTGSGKVAVDETKKKGGKMAELTYKVLSEIENYTLLEVIPSTGRLHQIRAQLADAGFPIKGDVKYGARRKNQDRSIHLHARAISLQHPTKNEPLEIVCPLPDEVVWQAFGV
jgi:23S rRNA pseudouridine1911/1915/1917 synthase